MPQSKTTIFVCVSCRQGDDENRPGRRLIESLNARLAQAPQPGIDVAPAECLAVCKRPATLAFAGDGKWTYVVGDIDAEAHVDDVIAAARSFAASENGIVPWKERPECFRKGVVSRTPPLPAAKD